MKMMRILVGIVCVLTAKCRAFQWQPSTGRLRIVAEAERQRGRGGSPQHGPSRRPAPAYREGDWTCKNCNAHNFASRDKCFRCGAKSHVTRRPRRRQRDPFWKLATADNTPKQVAEALVSSLWWTSPLDDTKNNNISEDQRRAYSLADDNFCEPAFNPRINELAPCYPEFYEEGPTYTPPKKA